MFTGLIADVGRIERVTATEAGLEFRVACAWNNLAVGESIATNGACLTVLDRGPGWFTVAAVHTTLGRTTMARWQPGRRVNLERALLVSDRLGGHFVLGHVDGVGEVIGVGQSGDARLVDVVVPESVWPLVVPHGSIAIDGVSLTVNAMREPCTLQLSLIGHTLGHTTLGGLHPGDEVQVEADVLGKYVRRLSVGATIGSFEPAQL